MLDLTGIKSQLQTILSRANTTTSVNYLSAGLSQRIQRILRVNPSRIPIQADWYPCVTVFVEEKSIELLDIVPTFESGLRKAELSLKVIGAVWNNTITNEENDPADDECEKLMENIENIFRKGDGFGVNQIGAATIGTASIGNASEIPPGRIIGARVGTAIIGSSVIGEPIGWYYPSGVTYHNLAIDEGVSLRAGMMTLETQIYY